MAAIYTLFSALKNLNWKSIGVALTWVAIAFAIVFALRSAYLWAYNTGAQGEREAWLKAEQTQLSEAIREIEMLHVQAREAEKASRERENILSAKYQKENQDEKKRTDHIIAQLRAGALKLRDPYRGKNAESSGSTGSSIGADTGRCNGEAGGEFSGETSEFLVELTGEADEVVNQLTYAQKLLVECRAIEDSRLGLVSRLLPGNI